MEIALCVTKLLIDESLQTGRRAAQLHLLNHGDGIGSKDSDQITL